MLFMSDLNIAHRINIVNDNKNKKKANIEIVNKLTFLANPKSKIYNLSRTLLSLFGRMKLLGLISLNGQRER